MTVIRGATTIARDEKEDVQNAVKELLQQIVSCNNLKRDEILSIIFSTTSDIHSYYPAKAAREAGFEGSSLFSALEPDIEGGLKLCIRVMLFVERNIKAQPVYLHGAKTLRKDLTQRMNIALDGPSGSGKSTIAKRLAKEYDILYLDTGAMYRACALKVFQSGVTVEDEAKICEIMRTINLDIEYENGTQKTILDGEDVSEKIREPHVSMAASTVSKFPCVRKKMVEKQREIAGKMSCVLDGRDIGTCVLPDAEYKFFLTASPEVRAKRRYDELTAKGFSVNYEELKEEIILRDMQDSSREISPLKQAEDAILVDSSDMTIEEVVATIRKKLQEKV